MSLCRSVWLFIILFLAGSASAGIYKWVDENGKTHFTDRPPQSQKTEQVTLRINTYTTPEISELESVVAAGRGVIMYSTEWCGVCKKAKRYFKQKGIRYTEFDIEKNPKARAEFKRLGGKGVPVILIGKRRMNGFSPASFQRLYGG